MVTWLVLLNRRTRDEFIHARFIITSYFVLYPKFFTFEKIIPPNNERER